jgi:hypothetical protein
VARIPVPAKVPAELSKLVREYLAILSSESLLGDSGPELARMLAVIDATVLQAYDLPMKLERQLLTYFRGSERPIQHAWAHWDELYPTPGLSLAEKVSDRFKMTSDWVAKLFRPLPEDEVALLRDYVA